MVYMHMPDTLTEEEEILQIKYAKLRKKKRALQALRAPKPDPQPVLEDQKKKKSHEEAADATEKAKKLLKLGAIKVEAEKKDHQGFKRTKRQKETDKCVVGFTPFCSSQSAEDDDKQEVPHKKVKGLQENFVPAKEKRDYEPRRDKDRDRDMDRRKRVPREREREPPKRGNTVYVSGHGITEEILQKSFSNIGKIVNISVETEKRCGFITFEKMDAADEAVTQMNSSMVSGIQLRVSMARRQPIFEQSVEQSNSTWSAIAASTSQKGSQHKDHREIVTYENNIF